MKYVLTAVCALAMHSQCWATDSDVDAYISKATNTLAEISETLDASEGESGVAYPTLDEGDISALDNLRSEIPFMRGEAKTTEQDQALQMLDKEAERLKTKSIKNESMARQNSPVNAQNYDLHQDAMETIFECSEKLDGDELADGTLPILTSGEAGNLTALLEQVRNSKKLHENDAELLKIEEAIVELFAQNERHIAHNNYEEQHKRSKYDDEQIYEKLIGYLYGDLVAKACQNAGIGFNGADIEAIENFIRDAIRNEKVPSNIADRAWNDAKAQYTQVAYRLTDRDCTVTKSFFARPLVQAYQKAMDEAEANGTLEANPFR